MDLPIELRAASERLAAGVELARLKRTARDLSDRYRTEGGTGKALLSEDMEAVVYALVRMPATFGAVSDALRYALEYFNGSIRTLLDVGAGSGAAAWAASGRLALEGITCVEREGAMRRVGEALMKEGSGALANARWISSDLTAARVAASADLVVSSYVLNEMAKGDRPFVLDSLWDAAEKMLLLVEPGTPAGSAVIRDSREYLLSKGAHIAAPCPHESVCKLAEDDWCHFTCRVQRSRLHKLLKDADAPYEDEKYAYMAFVKAECAHASARILRHPYIDKGQIGLELCTGNDIKSAVVQKKDGKLFKAAKKAKHGDSIEIE